MQLVCVSLKKGNGGKKSGIPGSMGAKKKNEAATGDSHNPFFTDGGFYKMYKPHNIEPFQL